MATTHPISIILDLVGVLATIRRRIVEGTECRVASERDQGHVMHGLGTGQIEAKGRRIAHISGNRTVEPTTIEPEAEFIGKRGSEEMSISHRQMLDTVVVFQR